MDISNIIGDCPYLCWEQTDQSAGTGREGAERKGISGKSGKGVIARKRHFKSTYVNTRLKKAPRTKGSPVVSGSPVKQTRSAYFGSTLRARLFFSGWRVITHRYLNRDYFI